MRELAVEHGLDEAIIINTCAVTSEAVRKSRQAVRRMHRENPNATLVATGCAVQIDPTEFEAMPGVSTVLGNGIKLTKQAWSTIASGSQRKNLVSDIMEASNQNRIISKFGSRSRAHVQVQNGCDHRCTFCVIPYGRGNSRSVPLAEVVEQARVLCSRGYNEIVLSGVDITDWGKDLPESPPLGSLVQTILHEVPELQRLRLSSLDPVEIDELFLEALAGEQRLMPHLHLSVQAGDDLTLKRMKRRHLRDDVIRFCETARKLRPDIVFGADLIAGFPTETESMYRNTLRVVEECGLTWLHVFPYSRRSGTPADRMPQVDGATIRERAAELRKLGNRMAAEFLSDCVGSTGEVLIESDLIGRTHQFAEVLFSEPQSVGQIINAEFTSVEGCRLIGLPYPV